MLCEFLLHSKVIQLYTYTFFIVLFHYGLIQIYVHSSTIHNSQTWKQPKSPLTDEWIKKMWYRVFPDGAVVESLPANAGDKGSSPGLGRSHMPRSN